MGKKVWGVVNEDKQLYIDSLADLKFNSIGLFLELKGKPHGQKNGYRGLTAEATKAWRKYRLLGYSCIRVRGKMKEGKDASAD